MLDPGNVDRCLTVWHDRGDRTVRHAHWCPGEPPLEIDFPDLGGEPVCLSVSSRDDDAQHSVRHHLPCFRRPGTPSPPTPIGVAFGPEGERATLRFAHAERPALGTVIEWYAKGRPDTRQTTFVARAASVAAGEPVELDIAIVAEPTAASDAAAPAEWCVRGFSVGGALLGDASTGYSEWSGSACDERPTATLPVSEFLPWPKREAPPNGTSLEASYARSDRIGLVLLSDRLDDEDPNQCRAGLESCDLDGPPGSDGSAACIGEPGTRPVSNSCRLCARIAGEMTVAPRFVVYRQARPDAAAEPGNFHQVTPFIGAPWCTTENEGSLLVDTLDDPWISLANVADTHPWAGERLLFTDRFPFRGEGELRYQFVFLDERGEITDQRYSNWIPVQ